MNTRNKPIKVGIICDILAIGGQERALLNIVTRFHRERIAPTVYAFRGGPLADELHARGVPLVLGSQKAPWSWSSQWTLEDEEEKAGYLQVLSDNLRRDAIAAVIVFAWPDGVIAAQQAGVPVLIERLDGPSLLDKINDKSMFDRVVCQSQRIYQEMSARAHEFQLAIEQLQLIYPGVDLNNYNPIRFDKTLERQKLGLSPTDMLIGYVGRLHAEKNLEYLLTVFAKLNFDQFSQSVYLLILGPDQGEYMRLKTLCEQEPRLQKRVLFLEAREDVASILATLDIFAICSKNEGIPNAVLEAIAMGLPIVATDVGSIGEVVDSNGYLLPLGDANKLHTCLTKLIEQPDLRAAMAACSLTLRHNYDINNVVAQYEQLLIDCVADAYV